jgi:hypothetical protein
VGTTELAALPEAQEAPEKEIEPRVLTADVATTLRRVVRPDDEDAGDSVALIAEKAQTSTRTVYRVLSVSTETLSLDLADRLVLAANSHLALSGCRLYWPDTEETTPYF